MKRIGFTGKENGWTEEQKRQFEYLIADADEPLELHHGDCVGADCQAHELFLLLALEEQAAHRIVLHPPTNPDKRAYCAGADETRRAFDYLTRNKHIVEETEILYACPEEFEEIIRSGTWMTIRHARKLGVPFTVIYPDGRLEIENQ